MSIPEHWIYYTPDGVRYPLTVAKKRYVLTEEGTGMPPISYVSQKGAFQHGETLVDYYLEPRIIQLLIRHQYCNRNDYWDGRALILDTLRPNRAAPVRPGVLRKINSRGQKRDINAIILENPNFDPREIDKWDEWAFTEQLRFICYDPIWFNPVPHTQTINWAEVGELVFPITFPIVFGATTTATVTYNGTWSGFPTIDIYGPVNHPGIINETTGESISIAYNIPESNFVRISLTYGNKTVYLNDGTDMMGYVQGADFAFFHLVQGDNILTITGSEPGDNSKIELSWYDKYIGI